ncbi:MAG: hypothetical protein ABW061_28740 [Polyangiaceae bacterium]
MNLTRARAASLRCLVAGLVAFGCDLQNPSSRAYQFSVRISGDPGRPVAGAALTYKGKQVAVSDSVGLAQLSAHGQEGETVDFGVSCPEGYRSPTSPLSLRLTRLRDGSRIPEYQVTCAPALRDVVIAVRAENGADLPVKYLGRQVARTDAAGAAHFLLRVEPGAQLEVALDTRDKRWLRPQDPVAHFLTRSEDDVFVLEQPFVVQHDARHTVVTSKRGPVHF